MSNDHEVPIVELTLPAPIETVWQWIRDPELIQRWHGWEAESLAAEIQFIFADHATPDEDAHTLLVTGHLFTFESRGDETVVRLTRSAPALGTEWTEEYYEQIDQGWTIFLHQLRFALGRHRDDERRTVFLFGRQAGTTPTAGALGLADLASQPPGTRYAKASPTGDELAGEVWFATDHELGLTVDGWGDGLLIVAAGRDEPAGAATMAILTTYGMADGDVDALRERWTQWWTAHHAPVQLGAGTP